ncbi:tail fiber domain-containing protein [Parvicella tangerina]|uniref:Peptidase S74 domain-containing protein n=1 Tax=Parvicella tangerina TaxID=2829795 RepID=A0A916JPU6_9FLAO|nr:tail fiber domain-containing protein [Parvicella tangerina]CAG5086163.1 hypothetical protein CRYO30217_03029 [Parvicella tangerina]
MKRIIHIIVSTILTTPIIAQGVGINTTGANPDANTILDVVSEGANSTFFGLKVKNSGGTEQLVVRSDGRVGIMTNAPTYELDVNGDIGGNEFFYHNGDGDTYMQFTTDRIRFEAGNLDMLDLVEAGTDEVVINNSSGNIDFRVESNNFNDQFVVDGGSDQVFVRNTAHHLGYTDPMAVYVSDNSTVPYAISAWNQGTTGGAATFSNDAGGNGYNTLESTTDGSAAAGWFWKTSTSSNSFSLLVTNSASNNRFGVYDEDNTVALGYFTISDSRLKKEITPMTSSIDKVMLLNPVTYRLNNDEFPSFGTSNELQYGFLTQEVGQIFPDMVAENSILDPNHSSELRSDWSEAETPYSSMNYQALIAVLTKAMQEQQLMIEKQEEKIAELELIIQEILNK